MCWSQSSMTKWGAFHGCTYPGQHYSLTWSSDVGGYSLLIISGKVFRWKEDNFLFHKVLFRHFRDSRGQVFFELDSVNFFSFPRFMLRCCNQAGLLTFCLNVTYRLDWIYAFGIAGEVLNYPNPFGLNTILSYHTTVLEWMEFSKRFSGCLWLSVGFKNRPIELLSSERNSMLSVYVLLIDTVYESYCWLSSLCIRHLWRMSTKECSILYC